MPNIMRKHFAVFFNLVVCILLRVLDQVQSFRLTQHCLNSCLLDQVQVFPSNATLFQ
jgi:hypothetical protein